MRKATNFHEYLIIIKRELFAENPVEGEVFGLMMLKLGEAHRRRPVESTSDSYIFANSVGRIVNGNIKLDSDEEFKSNIDPEVMPLLDQLFVEAFRVRLDEKISRCSWYNYFSFF